MPSAFRDASGWIVRFRGIDGRRRSVRVPARIAASEGGEAAARAYAAECQQYVDRMRRNPRTEDVEHAVRIKAVTPEQASRLRPGAVVILPDRVTLEDAAKVHPSSRREATARPDEYAYHLDGLAAFVAHSGATRPGEVTLEAVQAWIHSLEASGRAPDTIRHKMLFLRRALVIGTRYGYPDPLAGFQLVERRRRKVARIEVWSLPELIAGLTALQASGEAHGAALLALSGLAGLRPSEIIRARVGDFSAGVLVVGEREAKSVYSVRDLPLPPTVAAVVRDLTRGRDADRPLLESTRKGKPAFDRHKISRWGRELTIRLTKRDMPVKCLRRSFATWAVRVARCSRDDVDDWMGRRSGSNPVLDAHYLAAARCEEFRPMSRQLERVIADGLRKLSTQVRK